MILELDGDYIVLAVEDNGVGISEEILSKIYDPFFTTKQIGKGTGLGLSITKKIIKGHDGILSVLSKTGEGTIFTIKFPRIK